MVSANHAINPWSLSSPAMQTIPPSQTIASQASLLPVMSSHFSVPVNTRIITRSKLPHPCACRAFWPVAQRASIRMNTPNIIFSPMDHLPRLASCSLASSWAAFVSWSSGFKSFKRNHGNKSKLTNPGTMRFHPSHPSELNALARITRRFGDQAIGGHSSQEHCGVTRSGASH